MGALSAAAVPAKPTPVRYVQPDGSAVTVQLRGDERHHWYQTVDGYPLVMKRNILFYGETTPDGKVEASRYQATDTDNRGEEVKRLLSTVDRAEVVEAMTIQRERSPRVINEKFARAAARAKSKTNAPAADPTVADVYGKGLFPGAHFPAFGEQKGLVILVEYADVKFSNHEIAYGGDVRGYFSEMLNGDAFEGHGATGSARKWFIDNSAGQFVPTFDVFGPVTLEHDMAYYGGNDFYGNDEHPEMMVVEACRQLDPSVDFSQYDRDGDGYVDNVYVFYAGRGEASGGSPDTVWPHSWNLASAGITMFELDGVVVDRYACSNEWEGESPDGIGTFVHEFSHVMGLPDIYPTSYTEAFSPGDFCVMDHGSYNNDGRTPPNYGIFERNALGWMKPKQLSADVVADITIEPISTMDGYVVLTNRSDEFYLIENRQLEGWDSYLPGHGMLVWHIDYNASLWDSNTLNNDKDHQCVDIVEADDVRSSETRGGDTFPGTRKVTSFTHRTSPAMKTWAGKEIKNPLRDIREEDGLIVFNGGYIPVPAPGTISASEVPDSDVSTSSFTAKWTLDANSTYYLVNVYNDEHRVFWNNRNVGNVGQTVITGLKPDNTYYFTVTPCNEDANGEPSNEVMVRTLPPTLDFLKTDALEASEIGDTYFTANWQILDAATDYIINVTKQDATPLNEVIVTFDDGAEGLPEGWKTNVAATTDDSSLCGASAPALYFDKKGYLMTSAYPESVKKVRFNLKVADATAGSLLKVMGMAPGSYAWKEIEIINLDAFDGPLFSSFDIPENVNSLYLEFVPVGDCKIAIDDLSVVYGGTATSSTPHEVYSDYNVGNVGSFKLENLEPDTQYEYNVQAINPTHHARVSDTVVVRTKPLGESNVGEIEVDVTAPTYYNLQGIKVVTPRPGEIYIQRRGTSTRKVVVR